MLTSGRSGDRLPPRTFDQIYFYTSSADKYLQARRVFERHLLTVDYFKSRTDPYEEGYDGTTEELLIAAVGEITSRIGSGHLLFIEDTSLRLEALSTEGVDFPGLKVKHWFEETSFEECDASIRAAGGDRRAVVKSDIALKIPGLQRPILFHAESHGAVAASPPHFATNPQYPWLTPETFNGWFVPHGCVAPLGALEPDEAFRHDFRVRAFEKLIDRLKEYSAILNLPASAYRRRRTLRTPASDTPTLFSTQPSTPATTLLVVGRTCAGKSTFAEYVSSQHGLMHIEASAIVRSLGEVRKPEDDPGGFSYAKRVLDRFGHDIVVRTIVGQYGTDLERPVVISGLRDVEEVRYMRGALRDAVLVLVEAPERTRFDRHIRRARPGAETRLVDFRKRDRLQDEFGLLPVVEDLADMRIVNDGRLAQFHEQIDALLARRHDVAGVDIAMRPRHGPDHNQLFRCLAILEVEGRPLSCDEIQRLSANDGQVIRHNNANKVLKTVPALAKRIDPGATGDVSRVQYEVLEAGRTYLALMRARRGYVR